MKRMKKLASLLLAMVMVLSMTVAAFAEGETKSYTITIRSAREGVSIGGNTYNAYKLFNLTMNDYDNPTAYAYTIAEGFENFSYTVDNKNYQGEALVEYVKNIQDVKAGSDGIKDNAELNKIAAQALAFATNPLNSVPVAGTASPSATDKEATITLSTPGYYLVSGEATSDNGDAEDNKNKVTIACALTTTDPKAEVIVKADAPTIDKVIVNADSNNGNEGKGTAQDIGSDVEFKLTSTVPNMVGYDTYDYIVHDTLSSGLTFKKNTVVVKIGETVLKNTTDYDVVDSNVEPDSFKIVFNNFIEQKDNAGKTITITYSATINENALNTSVETNKVNLEYSNNPYNTSDKGKTPDKTVYVYDFVIDIDKFAKDDTTDNPNDNTRLAGAKFVLYKEVDGKKLYYHLKEVNGEDVVEWVELEENQKPEDVVDDSNSVITQVITDVDGKASFKGLDSGTYHLYETEAPNGYNKLKDVVDVEIKAEYNEDGTLKEQGKDAEGKDIQTDTTVIKHQETKNGATSESYVQKTGVENSTGAQLPSTGGIGRTIFYAAGIILMAGAMFFVVRRKRA